MSYLSNGRKRRVLLACSAVTALVMGAGSASASSIFTGNLVVSSLTYEGNASTVSVGQALPNCTGGSCIAATNNGSYGQVFLNDNADANFGVTAPYSLQFYSANGQSATLTSTYAVPNSAFTGSFSSKSEGAINVSADGQSITLMGYNSGINQIDVSNSNTPGSTETGNTDVATPTYRTVAQINSNGTSQFTNTNAYSGNNGRAVILGADGNYYAVGNGGNGNGDGNIATLTGVQRITPGGAPASNTTQIGAFNVTQDGLKADKASKDNNYRGLTIAGNTIYVTKGSGSNGIDTVYQVGTQGQLPTTGNASTPINTLPGLPVGPAKTDTNFFPFGVWFANSTTMYVADEGAGSLSSAASDANAGLEKWTLNTATGQWSLDYVLQSGLNLGQLYTVSGTNGGVAGSWTAATDGLRNITGQVNADGSVTIYAVTSTADDGTHGDTGADPDKIVAINDILGDTSAGQASGETFNTLETADYGTVFRGVALVTPVPEPATWAMMMLGLFGLGGMLRHRRRATVAA
jgi:hypothetical protein